MLCGCQEKSPGAIYALDNPLHWILEPSHQVRRAVVKPKKRAIQRINHTTAQKHPVRSDLCPYKPGSFYEPQRACKLAKLHIQMLVRFDGMDVGGKQTNDQLM